MIRDQLDIGRPSSIALIIDRRVMSTTPGTFRTTVITNCVDPQVKCYYEYSRVKQCVNDHRALRTEAVISDTHDFDVGRRMTSDNWRALRAAVDRRSPRLCDAQASDAVQSQTSPRSPRSSARQAPPTGSTSPDCGSATPESWPSWPPPSDSCTSSPASTTAPGQLGAPAARRL
jgi:hypothetical protein